MRCDYGRTDDDRYGMFVMYGGFDLTWLVFFELGIGVACRGGCLIKAKEVGSDT